MRNADNMNCRHPEKEAIKLNREIRNDLLDWSENRAPKKMRAGSLESKTTRIKAERLECKKASEEEKNEGLRREKKREGRGERKL